MTREARRLKIFLASLNFLTKRLEEIFGDESGNAKIIIGTSSNYVRDFISKARNEKKKGPFIAMVLSEISLNREVNRSLFRDGIKGSYNEEASTINRVKLRKVDARLNLVFITAEYEKIISFVENWSDFVTGEAAFELRVDDVAIPFRVEFDESLQIPRHGESLQPFDEFYSLETSIILRSFIGTAEERPVVKKIYCSSSYKTKEAARQ
jgi:hypothetical protein